MRSRTGLNWTYNMRKMIANLDRFGLVSKSPCFVVSLSWLIFAWWALVRIRFVAYLSTCLLACLPSVSSSSSSSNAVIPTHVGIFIFSIYLPPRTSQPKQLLLLPVFPTSSSLLLLSANYSGSRAGHICHLKITTNARARWLVVYVYQADKETARLMIKNYDDDR